MPVAAIAGMVISGLGAVAATTMAGMIFAGMSFVGSALSLIGQVTGNEKLAKIGGIIGMVGGAGSLVNSFTSVANAAGSTASTAAEAASTATAGNTIQDALAASSSAVPLSDLGKTLYGSSGILSGTNPALSAAAGSTLGSTFGSTPGAALGFDIGSGLGSGAGSAIGGGTGAALGFDIGSGLGSGAGANAAGASFTGAATNDSGLFSNINTWLEKNKEIVKVGSDVLSGISKAELQKDQAKAYEDALRLKGDIELALQQGKFDYADSLMERYSQSIKGLQQPQQIFKENADIYSGTSNGENVKRGIINRVWQPSYRQTQGA